MKASSTLKYLAPLCAAAVLSACGGGSSGGSSTTTTPTTYVVNAVAGAGGSIAPESAEVNMDDSAEFTLTPDSGYVIAGASGCEGTLSGDTFTTGPVTADCTVEASFAPAFSSVGGSVSGLNAGTSVTLQNNGGDDLVVPADGSFTFPSAVAYGGDYSVTVASQPFLQQCSVSSGSGTISGADVSGVAVSCVTVAAPDAPQPSLGYGIKQLQFSWSAVPGATYYRLSENPDGASGYSVVADNLTATAVNHDITLYNRVNARYMVEACNDFGCSGSSEIFMANNLVDAIGYFKASNAEEYDEFGFAVSLSADGTTLAVGATREDSAATGVDGDETDNSGTYSGAVYIFSRSGAGWAQQAYLKAANAASGDEFGAAVSLSADGATLAVGAWGEDSGATGVDGDQLDNSASNSGAVYLFAFDGTNWAQQAYLKASNTESGEAYGYAVSLSADGTTLAVGAPGEDSAATGVDGDGTDNSASLSGAVYLFAFDGTSWAQQAYLKASNTDVFDQFGLSVSLSADGDTLAVGADNEDSSATGIDGDQTDNSAGDSGAVYLFSRSGTAWSQQAYLKASNTGAGDAFGTSVSLSADGATLAVGALDEDSSATGIDGDQTDNSAGNSGAVYLFAFDGTSWAQQAYLKASNINASAFGTSASLSADGTTLAVGTANEDSAATGIGGDQTDNSAGDSGAVYLFSRSGTAWSQQAYIKASNTGVGDNFGASISLSADGTALAVGAIWEDSAATGIGGDQLDNSALNSGAVYLY